MTEQLDVWLVPEPAWPKKPWHFSTHLPLGTQSAWQAHLPPAHWAESPVRGACRSSEGLQVAPPQLRCCSSLWEDEVWGPFLCVSPHHPAPRPLLPFVLQSVPGEHELGSSFQVEATRVRASGAHLMHCCAEDLSCVVPDYSCSRLNPSETLTGWTWGPHLQPSHAVNSFPLSCSAC